MKTIYFPTKRNNKMGIDNLVEMGYTLIEGKEVVKYLPNTKNLINSFQDKLPEGTPQAYIAGGFVREIYAQMVIDKKKFNSFKDIDFFIPDCPEGLPKIEWWDDLDIYDQLQPYFATLEEGGMGKKDDKDYPQDHVNGVMAVYGTTLTSAKKQDIPIDLIFRTERTMHDVLQDFDYDAVKGIIDPVTLNMYVSPEMKKFFEEKDTSSIPDRATDFKYKLWSISNDWKDKGSKDFSTMEVSDLLSVRRRRSAKLEKPDLGAFHYYD